MAGAQRAFLSIETGQLGLPPLPVPEDNPQSPEKIALGEKLYNETRFSGDGTVGCVTCHDPKKGFTDNLPTSKGIRGQFGTRNAPTVINAAYYKFQFWDGRRPDLEGQAKDPFLNPIEHGLQNHDQILDVIRKDAAYTAAFQKVFQADAAAITIDHVVGAIAAFERTVISGDSPFDRYLYGKDEAAISEAAKRGLALYRVKARCQDCHTIGQTSAIFTDDKFHNLGVGFKRIEPRLRAIIDAQMKAAAGDVDKSVLTDANVSELGRFAITRKQEEIGAFKTPTLRNIELTAPYMHDGSQKTLAEVVDFYNKGGEANPFLDSGIRPLNLTPAEVADLLAFLKTLTGSRFSKTAGP